MSVAVGADDLNSLPNLIFIYLFIFHLATLSVTQTV